MVKKKDKKHYLKKTFFYLTVIILSLSAGYIAMGIYLFKHPNNNVKDMAYCITLKDYLMKLKNKNLFFKNERDYKSSLYVFSGFLKSGKNILEKQCPVLYQKAVSFTESHHLFPKESSG